MRVEFDFRDRCLDIPDLCIEVMPRNHCHGVVQTHGRIEKREEDDAPSMQQAASKLGYRMPGRRAANKIIEVQGNCCWKFYERSRYAGDMRSVSGSRTLNPYFAPRSLKVVEC